MCFLDVSSSDQVSLRKGEQKSEWRFHISNISKRTRKLSSLNSWIPEIARYDLKSSEICDCFCLEYPDTPNFEGNSYLVKSWWFHTCCMFFVCFFSDKVSLAVSIFEWTCFLFITGRAIHLGVHYDPFISSSYLLGASRLVVILQHVILAEISWPRVSRFRRFWGKKWDWWIPLLITSHSFFHEGVDVFWWCPTIGLSNDMCKENVG